MLSFESFVAQKPIIAIVGLGNENIQFLQWLIDVVQYPINNIIVADKNENTTITDVLPKILKKNTYTGPAYLQCLERSDIEYVFKTPGIWSLKKEFVEFRKSKGEDKILNSMCFFFERFRDRIITVNGTKGKSTTSSMLTHMLNSMGGSNGIKAFYCGNTTNISPYKFWTNLEQTYDHNTYFVIETSSFQLQDLAYSRISPAYAIITNYYIDHLDQHASKEEYWNSKDTTFKFQKSHDILVYGPTVQEKSPNAQLLPKQFIVDEKKALQILKKISVSLPGDHNLLNIAQALTLCVLILSKNHSKTFKTVLSYTQEHHDLIQATVDSYSPLSHRLEKVRTIKSNIEIPIVNSIAQLNPVFDKKDIRKFGSRIYLKKPLVIQFFDDGAATEPEASNSAIQSLTKNTNNFIWIQFTGIDKGSDLSILIDTLLNKQMEHKLFRVDYCGEIGMHILEGIYNSLNSKQHIELDTFKSTIENAFVRIQKIVRDFEEWLSNFIMELEDTQETLRVLDLTKQKEYVLNILLSPTGSSFDEFSSYVQRSQYWVNKVNTME